MAATTRKHVRRVSSHNNIMVRKASLQSHWELGYLNRLAHLIGRRVCVCTAERLVKAALGLGGIHRQLVGKGLRGCTSTRMRPVGGHVLAAMEWFRSAHIRCMQSGQNAA